MRIHQSCKISKFYLFLVQCPKGTFHNKTLNSCQPCKLGHYNDKEGQTDCQKCQSYHSTRKLGAKFKEECIGMNVLFIQRLLNKISIIIN